MKKWNLCTGLGTSETKSSSKLHLTICELEGLAIGEIGNKNSFYVKVQIKWKAKKSYLYRRARDKSNTTKQRIDSDGCVRWNEGFEHNCNFKLGDHSSDWKIELKIQGQDAETISKPSLLAKVSIRAAEFAGLNESISKKLELPFSCCISGSIVEARLIVKLRCPEAQPQQINGSVHPISPTQKLVSLPSSVSFKDHSTNDKSSFSSDSEDNEQSYKRIIETMNLQNTSLVDDRVVYNKDEGWEGNHPLSYQETSKPSLLRLMSWNSRNHGSKLPDHPRDTPLLNKAYREDGGDDIDHARRCLLLSLGSKDRQIKNEFQASEFMGSDRFEVGKWEKKKLKSRDGKLELVTEMFLASIDQRSDKASGEGACSVLAAVIADWLHQNPKFLPLKCQFDKLIRDGSLEWRNLCKEESHKEKFSDQHFDLDTVLQAQVRPLMVVPEKSYIGFFELENQLDFLQGAMSFDNIWQELQQSESTLEEQIYVVSWNDHFFVLKIEKDAIYTIDTLGERLSEGCHNAYILKFSEDSKVYSVQPNSSNSKKGSGNDQNSEASNSGKSNKRECNELIGEGKLCCKEFIKGFLAAIPLEELQGNIKKGVGNGDLLHRLLQIEFQYMTPCPSSVQ